MSVVVRTAPAVRITATLKPRWIGLCGLAATTQAPSALSNSEPATGGAGTAARRLASSGEYISSANGSSATAMPSLTTRSPSAASRFQGLGVVNQTTSTILPI